MKVRRGIGKENSSEGAHIHIILDKTYLHFIHMFSARRGFCPLLNVGPHYTANYPPPLINGHKANQTQTPY